MNWWKLISRFGSNYSFFIANLIIFAYEWERGLVLFITFLITYGIVAVLRLAFFTKRPKPVSYKNLFEKIESSSFPSMHAVRIVLLWSFIPMGWVSIAFFLLTLLVSYSRIALKKHYWKDVIVGYLLALFMSNIELFVFILFWEQFL